MKNKWFPIGIIVLVLLNLTLFYFNILNKVPSKTPNILYHFKTDMVDGYIFEYVNNGDGGGLMTDSYSNVLVVYNKNTNRRYDYSYHNTNQIWKIEPINNYILRVYYGSDIIDINFNNMKAKKLKTD